LSFKQRPRFSIGFKSGDLAGQFITSIPISCRAPEQRVQRELMCYLVRIFRISYRGFGAKVGKNLRYNSSITKQSTPPRVDAGFPKSGIRREEPENTAQNICLVSFPGVGSPRTSPVSTRLFRGVKVYSRRSPIPRSTEHSSDQKSRAQSSGLKCAYSRAHRSLCAAWNGVRSGRSSTSTLRQPSS
jgi:hypothetical protein